MENIQVQITDNSTANTIISDLDEQLNKSIRSGVDFDSQYQNIVECINDFILKRDKLAKVGSTIHINRVFKLSGATITVSLDYPKRKDFLRRLSNLFKGK